MSGEKELEKERRFCERNYRARKRGLVPPFDFGEEFLFKNKMDNPKQGLLELSRSWVSNPNNYLSLKKHQLPKIKRKKGSITFSSVLDRGEDNASFYISFPPKPRTSKESVAIVVPHWNAKKSKYLLSVNLIRSLFLPLSTAIYFPSYEEDDEIEYDMVGPNLGLSLFRFWQDILNLKYFTNYLKKDLGFKKIGYFGLSIGNPRALLATLFSDIDIDFLVMNFLADDHTEAIMKGKWTREIAEVIDSHIEYDELKDVWMPMSPGAYEQYFNQLPKDTRLVQGKYDLVLGRENAKRITKKMPLFVNTEEGDFGHISVIGPSKSMPLMIHNARFIRKSVDLRPF